MTLRQQCGTSCIRIETAETFDFDTEDYRRLFNTSAATAFQGPLWLQTFYDILVPGTGAQPVIVKIFLNGSTYPDIIIPLVREIHFGIKIIQPADLGVADYNALIGRKENLQKLSECPQALREIQAALQPYDLFLFRKQPPYVFDASEIIPSSQKTANISSSYDSKIGDDFEGWYRATVSQNMRKGLKRKRNGFQKDFGHLTFSELTDKEAIEDAFLLMRKMRAARYEKDLFAQAYFDFYRTVAIRGATRASTSTFVGRYENTVLTVDFGLRHEHRFLFLLGGFSDDLRFQRYSLGLIGLTEIIRNEVQNGQTIFDFTIGDEDYKKSFGAEKIPLVNVTATSGLVGKAAFSAYQSRGLARGVLKTLMPGFN